MKQILRLFAGVGVVLLAALISAGSCDKDDGNKNTNNNNNNSGFSNPIIVTPVTAVAKVKDKTIYLKASAFPTTEAGDATANFSTYNGTAASTRKKAFDVEIDKATGGILVVANGDIKGATDITTPEATGIGTPLPTTDVLNKGIHVHVNTTTADVGTLKPGGNIFSVFADKTVPADAAAKAADKAPFAFTSGGATVTQPILWCVSTLTATTASAATSKLTGGQKAACYVASLGAGALGTATVATTWFTATTPANFKREIAVGVAGVRTDATTLDKIGLTAPAGTPSADIDSGIVGAFQNGIDKDEMKAIVETAAKNGLATHVGFKAYTIKIVNDTDFNAAK